MAKSMMCNERLIEEQGYLLAKYHKDPTNEWVDRDGKKVAAQPEKYVVGVASSATENPETGLENVTYLEYEVSENDYKACKFMSSMLVQFRLNMQYQKCIPVSATVLKK